MKDLKSLRMNGGFTHATLAKASELHQLTIQNIEAQKTLPQADCRRRLELVLGERVNWLQTTGIKDTPSTIGWEDFESSLRSSFYKVTGLSEHQQKDAVSLIQEYLTTLIRQLNERKLDENKISIQETVALTRTRKHKTLNQLNK